MNEPAIEVSIGNLRQHLAEILNATAARGRITYITNRRRRIAAIVPLPVAERAEAQE